MSQNDWFDAVAVVTLLIVITSIEDDEGEGQARWPLVCLFIGTGILYLINAKVFKTFFFSVDYQKAIVIIMTYLFLGLLWSLFKWNLLVKKQFKSFIEACNKSAIRPKKESYMPKLSENKEQVTSWILFWPLSGIRIFFGDLIVGIVGKIRDFFQDTYRKISESKFKDYE